VRLCIVEGRETTEIRFLFGGCQVTNHTALLWFRLFLRFASVLNPCCVFMQRACRWSCSVMHQPRRGGGKSTQVSAPHQPPPHLLSLSPSKVQGPLYCNQRGLCLVSSHYGVLKVLRHCFANWMSTMTILFATSLRGLNCFMSGFPVFFLSSVAWLFSIWIFLPNHIPRIFSQRS